VLRALKIGGHFGDLLAIGGAALMLRSGFGLARIAEAADSRESRIFGQIAQQIHRRAERKRRQGDQ
jgi:hypothetical protein